MPSDLISYSGTPLSLRDRRRDRVELREAARPGRHALVRVKAGYLITTVGLIYLEDLTERAVGVCKRCGPVADEQAARIVDGFVRGVETELALLPHRG